MKNMSYSKKHKELSIKFKALAHPARVKLVEDLTERECCVGEIQRCLSISQPNVSQHLKVLKEAGIIKGRREGVNICYSISDNHFRKALLLFLKGDE
jgi:ArsR family transcriptional regulator